MTDPSAGGLETIRWTIRGMETLLGYCNHRISCVELAERHQLSGCDSSSGQTHRWSQRRIKVHGLTTAPRGSIKFVISPKAPCYGQATG